MPPRSTPTARQKRLGSELRKMRTAAGLTTEAAAKLLGVPRTNLPNMESGRSGISAERVRVLAGHYGCTDTRWVDALAAMARERGRGWWEEYRGALPDAFLDIAEMEWHATSLRMALTVHLPGILQTEGRARALFEQVFPRLPEAEIEARVAHRLGRAQVLDKDEPPDIQVTVHEAALRMEFGGADVSRRQLAHLLDMSDRTEVTVRAIPFKNGGFPGAGQSVIYAQARAPQLDVVELDSTHGPEFIDSEAQLKKYRLQMDQLEAVTLLPEASRDFVHDIMQQI
ncbi:helix-turn-helix domain-containing protein [Streptomyces albireticuli]|uniref:helix-turn-helix domain-containing protein n=1 Tax=Streptomyces albireticuli TaxID=1940 RepID=UPI0036CF3B4B